MTSRPGRAVVLAVVCLAAALVYAMAPVRQDVDRFVFAPGDRSSSGAPTVAPLPIIAETPEALQVSLPCEVDYPASSFYSYRPELWDSRDGSVRASLVYPDLGLAAYLSVSPDLAVAALGGETILTEEVVFGPGCSVRLDYEGGLWSLTTPQGTVSTEADGPRLVEATLEGPATSSPLTEVAVSVRELGSSPTAQQHGALAVFVIAFLLLAWVIGSARVLAVRVAERSTRRRGMPRAELVDLVVAGLLLVWLLMIPVGFDDGWIRAIQASYAAVGDFSGVFENGGSTAAIGYWLNWFQHFWPDGNTFIVRLPALVLAGGAWGLMRYLAATARDRLGRSELWLMAAVFVVGCGAWGITLRPEPVIGLLLLASLALAVRFRVAPTHWVVFLWSLVIALGVTAHTAGVIVVAPLVVSVGPVLAWVRSDRPNRKWLVASGLGGLAAMLMLLVIDSNMSRAVGSISASRGGGHDLSVLDEVRRYGLLGDVPYATTMRRLAVAFVFVGVVAVLLGMRRRSQPTAARVVAWSLPVAVVLLSLTPSKWPWHFGGLVGLSALVLALEFSEARLSQAAPLRIGVGVAASSALTWVVATSGPWTALDLRSFDWWPGLDLSPVGYALIGLGFFGLTLLPVAIKRPTLLPTLAAVVAIAMTASLLVTDLVVTPGWTSAGQNISSLMGRGGCGLGDEFIVPVPGSLRTLADIDLSSTAADAAADDAGYRESGVFAPFSFQYVGANVDPPFPNASVLGSRIGELPATAEDTQGGFWGSWQTIDIDVDQVVVFGLGRIESVGNGNAIGVQWARRLTNGAESLGIERAAIDGFFLDWSLVQFDPPPGADLVRLLLRDGSAGRSDAWLAATPLLGIETAPLSAVAGRSSGRDVLVTAPLALYFPCVDTPTIRTTVPVPELMVLMWNTPWQETFAAAAATERYFGFRVDLDPPARDTQVGAHLGDPASFLYVGQEYLTGSPARATDSFDAFVP